ncbi:MAG: glycosyltransferase family 4 protein [Lentisphaeria bacterium]|nr:glycosyltransferase family 4 protein [Lentisphaeria bacterium]
MKILVNAFSARLGGGKVYIINLLKHLPPEYDVTILAGEYNATDFLPLKKDNITFEVKSVFFKNGLIRIFWELFVLPFFLLSRRFDSYFAPGGVLLTIPVHGILYITALRNMLPFDARERKRFPFFSVLRLKMWVLRTVYLMSYRIADRIVFISEYSRDCVCELYPAAKKKSKIIYHGLNDKFRYPEQVDFDLSHFGLMEKAFYLYVSRLDVYKAQLELIEEWRKLRDGGFTYPLVLVGETTGAYGQKVFNRIKEYGLENMVICTGAIPNDKLPGLYRQARALVFASSCECCPNILLEMMSSGRPIFSSSIPPMPEIGGHAVVYFDPYKSGELSSKIAEGEKNFSVFEMWGRDIRKRAFSFDWNVTIRKTMEYISGR